MTNKLKKAIIRYMFENENDPQLLDSCIQEFSKYIYDENGNYDENINGEMVRNFIFTFETLVKAYK